MAGINSMIISTIVTIVAIIGQLLKHPKGTTKGILRVVLVLGILAIVLSLVALSGAELLSFLP